MSISSVSAFLGAVSSVGSALSTRQNSPSSPLGDDLDQIREKGLSAWAHEQQMEKLKERLRAEVLAGKAMSEQDVAALPAEQQLSVEAEIEKMIVQKLQEAMQRAVEEAAETGQTQAILVDISV